MKENKKKDAFKNKTSIIHIILMVLEKMLYQFSFRCLMFYFTKVEVLRTRLDDYVRCAKPERRFLIAIAVDQIFRWSSRRAKLKIIKALGLDYQILLLHSLQFLSDNFFTTYGHNVNIHENARGAKKYAKRLEALLIYLRENKDLQSAQQIEKRKEFTRAITSVFDAKSTLLLIEAHDKFHKVITNEQLLAGSFDMTKMTKNGY